MESSRILACLALSDNGFLLNLLILNSGNLFNLDLFNTELVVCKFVPYFSYVFSFFSVSLIVSLNLKKLIMVVFPNGQSRMQQLEPYIILGLALFTIVFYSFSFLSTGIEYDQEVGEFSCFLYKKWLPFVKVFSVVDIFLTILFPFILILIINFTVYVYLKVTVRVETVLSRRQSLLHCITHQKPGAWSHC
jgi:hypothetical protein